MIVELSDEEMLCYNWQIVLCGFDFDGQEWLKVVCVLVVGFGGFGCVVVQYLVVVGVGQFILFDFDIVLFFNLQCQMLYSDVIFGQLKVDFVCEVLVCINLYVCLVLFNVLLDEIVLVVQIVDYDLVFDCIDNVDICNQFNVGCFQYKILLVFGVVICMEG